MTPTQKRTGITPDISAFLQFSFWEPVLYASHETSFPSTTKRPGHWVGVAHNVGDHLTFEIYDDQMKKIVTRSVVRSFNRNKHVQWDPQFARTPIKSTATHAGEIRNSGMDVTEADEPVDVMDLEKGEPTEGITNPPQRAPL